MKAIIKCVLIEDDHTTSKEIMNVCATTNKVKITEVFSSGQRFMDALPGLNFDICAIDLGITTSNDAMRVAKKLGDRPIIFIADLRSPIMEALDYAPLDIITKPIKQERLIKCFDKAYRYLVYAKEEQKHALFNVAGEEQKIKICLQDILLVKTDEKDPRNKRVYLRNGDLYTIMSCNFSSLLHLSGDLVQVNRTTLLSPDIIKGVSYDVISLKQMGRSGQPAYVTLSDTCRETFRARTLLK